ncbi:hypothetical protein ACHAXM_005932 [Skeletonema potamos]
MVKAYHNIIVAAIVCICCMLGRTSAFSLGKFGQQNNRISKEQMLLTQPSFPISSDDKEQPISEAAIAIQNDNHSGLKQSLLAGCITFLTTTPFASFADDLEVSELPPPYIPVVFGILVIGGVGVLTASLGDVYTEESNLGLQSGARAKKERERSRSSYFKK